MQRTGLLTLLTGGVLVAATALLGREAPPRITLPPGFELEEVLSPDQAGTVVAITFDSQGRLVLAKETGRVVTAIPQAGGGYELRVFSDEVHTSQGVLFDGRDLIVDGSGPQGVGLYRVVDEDGDARGERVELIELSTGRIEEHGPHAPFWGPDGHLYWTHGNFSNVYSTLSPLSPVRSFEEAVLIEGPDPRGFGDNVNGATAGSFIRKGGLSRLAQPQAARSPQGTGDWELVSMGFRNQYDGAFNLIGELFTFDSDMEWDRDLPWYRPTRTLHAAPGGDFGFREGSDKHPDYYFDDLPAVENLGRGSPTGVGVYQAYNYPREYADALLQADWSRGRVVVGRLTRSGASYRQQSTNFIYGEPLNVTDVDVGPDGNVYFALGGRNTGGGIYRVVYRGSDAMPKPQAATPLDRVLTMIQPRSAFSRQLAADTKREMGEAAWQQALTAVVRDARDTPERRVRAMELLQVFGPGLDENTLVPLKGDPAWEVRAASTYYLGMKTSVTARRELASRLKDSDPFVQRRAAEALLRTGIHPFAPAGISAADDVFPLLASPDRHVRYAARTLLRQIDPNEWKEAAFAATAHPQAVEGLMAYLQTLRSPDIWAVGRLWRRELELLQQNPSDRELLDLVRLVQRTILKSNGVRNVAAGRSARGNMQAMPGAAPAPAPAPAAPGAPPRPSGPAPAQVGQLLLARFPTADSLVNREIARVFAALETQGAVPELTAELGNPRNGREQQIHYAYLLSFMETGWEPRTMDAMAAWIEKVYTEEWRGGAGFGPAIDQIRGRWLEHVPTAQNPRYTQRLEDAQKRAQQAMVARAAAAAGSMNPMGISDEEAFEELVYNPNVEQGNAAAGAAAYLKGQCGACHTFGPIGAEFGPDLSTVGQRFSRKDLLDAIVHPSAVVSDQYQAEEIVRSNGSRVLGVARDAGDNVVVQVAGGREVTIPRSQVRSRARSERSPMPEGLLNLLSATERRNLFWLLLAGPAAIPDSTLTRMGVSR